MWPQSAASRPKKQPWVDGAAAPCLLVLIAGLALTAAALTLDAALSGPHGLGRAAASAVVHATFFASGWILATNSARGWVRPALTVTAVMLPASVLSRLNPTAALMYLVVPLVVLRIGRHRMEFRRIGLATPARLVSVLVGLGAGALLGAHLLLSVSLTFGYRVEVANSNEYLAAVAYDIGANALTVEWLFCGALFSRWWRASRFWPAAALATMLIVTRYIFDPALPSAAEVRAGAVFYTALLGLGGCVLRAWSGSLLPGYAATVAFFAVYRLLAA